MQGDAEKPMSMTDAMQMPLIAGGALVTLFLAFKYVDKDMVNLVLRLYFLVVGTFAVTDCVAWMFEAAAEAVGTKRVRKSLAVLPWGMGSISIYHVPAFVVGVAVAGGEMYAKLNGLSFHWLLNNSVGAAVCFGALGKLSLGSARIGMLLLMGLFVYDIVMVFGTESIIGEGIMQSVAGKVDGPILLMFPHYNSSLPAGELPKFSKLGLGDICFPGAFIALLLRYDAFRSSLWLPASDPGTASQRKQMETLVKEHPEAVMPHGFPGGAALQGSFGSPYFATGLVMYAAGLAVTLVAMLVSEHPQPALLYLSPACCVAAAGTAIALGDWSGLMEYSEEAPEDGFVGKPRDDGTAASDDDDTKDPAPAPASTSPLEEEAESHESDGISSNESVESPTRRRQRRE
jgi:minor histocompatibility antigen H13